MRKTHWLYTGLTVLTTLLAYGGWFDYGNTELAIMQVDTRWAAVGVGFMVFAASSLSWGWLHPQTWCRYLLCGTLTALLSLIGLGIVGGTIYFRPSEPGGILWGIAGIVVEFTVCVKKAGIPLLGLCLTIAVVTRLFAGKSSKQQAE